MQGEPTTFWGKLRREEDDGSVAAWHPLIDHCADVAACCEALLRLPLIARRLARLADRPHLHPTTRARLCVLCALHDLGKLNHGFQRKGLRTPRDTAGHVTEALALLNPNGDPALFDPFFEAADLPSFAPWITDEGTLMQLLTASIAHHGRPHAVEHCGVQRRFWLGPGDAFAGIRALVDAARAWFPEAWREGPPLPDAPAFAHAFSGLVTLADWLGSNPDTSAFPYTVERDYDPRGRARIAFARERAPEVLGHIGLDTASARRALGPAPGFDRISEYTPRPAQAALHGLPAAPGGSITVLEAETGSGKTEAALARFMSLFAAGEVDGLYFALPTRTAATQLEARVHSAMQRAFADDLDAQPPVTLAVPGYLRVDGVEGRKLARFEYLWNDRPRARWRFRTWAAENAKRYLAGAVVVGTVDQVLLSALRVDHAHLRATSLLRHLLVVDEVHASDAYMTRLLEAVLTRHRAAGGHALLLSATLGGEARRRLLHPGERTAGPALGEARAAPYPLVSHRVARGAVEPLTVPHHGRRRAIEAEQAPIIDDPEAIARRALAAARAGARVLVLRNTVKGCLAVQQALEALVGRPRDPHDNSTALSPPLGVGSPRRAPGTPSSARLDRGRNGSRTHHADFASAPLAGDGPELFRCQGVRAPHHSRFARVDRAALDGAIEATFGKARPTYADDRRGVVAVATQTVEQSLDLDADLMITDLCPMDVLLQRVGRLHRHERAPGERAPGFEDARVVVLVPAERDLAAAIDREGRGNAGHGLGSVYLDLRVVEATWRELERDPVLRVPDQCRARVEAAVHSEALAAIAASDARWQRHATYVVGQVLAKSTAARLNLLGWQTPFGDPAGLFPEKGDRRPPTRLGDDDRLFDLPKPAPTGPFGEPVDQLKAPGWMARDVGPEPEIAVTGRDPEGFDFTVDGAPWRYDRHGLRKA